MLKIGRWLEKERRGVKTVFCIVLCTSIYFALLKEAGKYAFPFAAPLPPLYMLRLKVAFLSIKHWRIVIIRTLLRFFRTSKSTLNH